MAKGDETRAAILRKATELASIGGFEALSVGVLAEAMGMSKSGVFGHFRSKESLDLAVIEYARERFVDHVFNPAFKAKRGLPRVEALVERLALWITTESLPGGCPLLAAAFELDDRPGEARDQVASSQRDLLSALAHTARIAIEEGHFRPDLDLEQFAFDVHAAMIAGHVGFRLLRDPVAIARFRTSVGRAIDDARIR